MILRDPQIRAGLCLFVIIRHEFFGNPCIMPPTSFGVYRPCEITYEHMITCVQNVKSEQNHINEVKSLSSSVQISFPADCNHEVQTAERQKQIIKKIRKHKNAVALSPPPSRKCWEIQRVNPDTQQRKHQFSRAQIFKEKAGGTQITQQILIGCHYYFNIIISHTFSLEKSDTNFSAGMSMVKLYFGGPEPGPGEVTRKSARWISP